MSKLPEKLEGYYEKMQSARQSRPPSRAEKRRQSTSKSVSSAGSSDRPYNDPQGYRKCDIVKHDCLKHVTIPASRSQSLPPRPPTRRKPVEMPNPNQYVSRARSSGPSNKTNDTSMQKSRSARSQRSVKTTPIFAYFATVTQDQPTQEASYIPIPDENSTSPPTPAPRNSKTKKRDTSFKNSISDHEYLQFSLRITEDIIRNDLYTNKEMRRVFNSHIEANRGRLDMDKMSQQIENLCRQLNIPLDESQDDDLATRSQIKAQRQTIPANVACICGPISRPLNAELKDCECGSKRCLPFQCVQHSLNSIESESKINEKFTNVKPDDGSGSVSVNFEEDVIETHYYENPETDSNSLESNPSFETNVLSDFSAMDNEPIVRLRQSVGCIELPSLSCVTERTEPTSNSSLENHVEMSDHCVESVSEFDTTEALPGFENLEKSEQPINRSLLSTSQDANKKPPRRKSISFDDNIILAGSSDKPALLQSKENKLPELCEKLEVCIPTAVEDVSANSLNSNVIFWSVCSFDSAKPPEGLKLGENVQFSKDREINKIVAGVQPLPQHLSPLYITDRQTKSEPIQSSEQLSVPYSMKEYSSGSQQSSLNEKSSVPSTTANQGIPEKTQILSSVCDNTAKPEFQVLQLKEVSNVRVYGPNNKEEEFVLFPGPIYVPKSSVVPANNRDVQNFAILTPQILFEKDAVSFTKDAIVNTDEQMSNLSNTINTLGNIAINNNKSQEERLIVLKEDNSSSILSTFNSCMRSNSSKPLEIESATYSQMHDAALHTVHYPSITSNVSHVSGIPQKSPDLENQYFTKIMIDSLEKPKAILKHKFITADADHNTQSNYIHSSYEYQEPAARIAQLNDYDLTPQRDITQSVTSSIATRKIERKPEAVNLLPFNKDSLLLGDEYEIKDNLSKKSSSSSCYDNGLPQAICKFYPNMSTQTQSSDWLPTIKSSPKFNQKNDIDAEVVKSLNDVDHDDEVKPLKDVNHNDKKTRPSKDMHADDEAKPLKDVNHNDKKTKPPKNMHDDDEAKHLENAINHDEAKPSRDVHHNDEVKPLKDVNSHDKAKPLKDVHYSDEVKLLNDEHTYDKAKPSKDVHYSDEVKPSNDEHTHDKAKPSKDVRYSAEIKQINDVHSHDKAKPLKDVRYSDEIELINNVHAHDKAKLSKDVRHSAEVERLKKLPSHDKPEPFKRIHHNNGDVTLRLVLSNNDVESLQDDVYSEVEIQNVEEQVSSSYVKEQESVGNVEIEEPNGLTFTTQEVSAESFDLSDILFGNGNVEENGKQSQQERIETKDELIEVEEKTEPQNKQEHIEVNEDSDDSESDSDDEDDDDDDDDDNEDVGFYSNLDKSKEKEKTKEKLEASDVAFVTYGKPRPSKGEDDDILSTLDQTPSEIVPRSSIMLTVEKVTTDLEKLRNTEIPPETYVQTKYNIPIQNRKLLLADDLPKDDPIPKSDDQQLPYIEVPRSEIQIPQMKNEKKYRCCGLKKLRKKIHNDSLHADESADNIPNISAIPDDQLYDFDARRLTERFTVERKSLRFDYSPMAQFDTSPENIRLRRSTGESSFSGYPKRQSSVASDEYLPSVRHPVVNYKKRFSTEGEHDSVVSFDDRVSTINGSPHNSVVEILRPTGNSVESMENINAERKEVIKTSIDNSK
ncbi:hypothetical protein ILUMI_21476 [Ignelater luminosus]|uniref:Uncharacterized protein n=1 Tax=Ignelater luminosus TaxID=2038154 RepID=A0A8K0CCB8_IGNLU|nr:hypothetical protein ILUMI_21476 [Ignelater luminosus]